MGSMKTVPSVLFASWIDAAEVVGEEGAGKEAKPSTVVVQGTEAVCCVGEWKRESDWSKPRKAD